MRGKTTFSMKRFIFFIVVVLAMVIVARAEDGEEFLFDGLKYRVLSEVDKTVELTKVTYDDEFEYPEGALILPENLDCEGVNYTVVAIGESAMEEWMDLTSVVLPNSVTVIGPRAFLGCSSLESIQLPSALTSIDYQAFAFCKSLNAPIIPASVEMVGGGLFQYCDQVKEIEVAPGNKHYRSEGGVLYDYSGTTLLECPAGRSECVIADGVTTIDAGAFHGCRNLTSLTLPESVKRIEDEAFADCGLTSLRVPDSVTYMGESVFEYSDSVAEVVLSEGLTEVGHSTFDGCVDLCKVVLPSQLNQLSAMMFSECTGLSEIIAKNPTPPAVDYATFDDLPTDVTIYVPSGSAAAYRSADGWNRFSDFREM